MSRASASWSADLYRLCASATPGDLLRALRRDRVFRVIFTSRICQSHTHGKTGSTILGKAIRRLHRWTTERAGMDFPWEAQTGPGLAIVHGWGIVISPDAIIGSNVTIFHGTTIGRKDDISVDGTRTVGGSPIIESDVWIGPHVLILGGVRVGEGSRVGGGSVVTKDVPPRSLVIGNPARVVQEGTPPDTPNRWPPKS